MKTKGRTLNISNKTAVIEIILGIVPLVASIIAYKSMPSADLMGPFYWGLWVICLLVSPLIAVFGHGDLAQGIFMDKPVAQWVLILIFTAIRTVYYYFFSIMLAWSLSIDIFSFAIMSAIANKVHEKKSPESFTYEIKANTCSACGKVFVKGDKFCGRCGHDLTK